MEMIEIVGYGGAVIAGVLMGIFGGGGSILTLPIVVYIFKTDSVLGTAYSLFIVGISAMVGTIRNIRTGTIAYKKGFFFALPSLVTVFLVRKFGIPAIPDPLNLGILNLSKDSFIMVLFALVMFFTAYRMITSKKTGNETTTMAKGEQSYGQMFGLGIVVGIVTALVGAGGGFLIVPALVLFGGVSMHFAVGTSLMIIMINSLVGFLGDMGTQSIDWGFLGTFSLLCIGGITLGGAISSKLSGEILKRGFGYFVLTMAVIILIIEF